MNAEQHDNLMRAIERDEAWLADAMGRYPTPAPISLDAAKSRVRTELQVATLLDAGLPSATAAVQSAKAAVWGELLRAAARPDVGAAQPAPRAAGWWWRHRIALGTLAAAAAIALLVLPMVTSTPDTSGGTTVATSEPPAQLGIDDYSAALALPATDDFDSEVADVASDLDELYESFTLVDDTGLDSEFDDLDSELDSLMQEFSS